MSTATTTVLGHLNTKEQTEAKKNTVIKTAAINTTSASDITREKWFWEIAVPS